MAARRPANGDTVRSVEFDVEGIPVPQGSKVCICKSNRPVMFDDAKGLGPWRTRIKQAARFQTVTWVKHTPLMVELIFVFQATEAHPSGWKVTAPDEDKLIRAVLDALKIDARGRGVLPDDAQVVRLVVDKVYGPTPGVRIRVSDAPNAYGEER